jgi:hypothetical protein
VVHISSYPSVAGRTEHGAVMDCKTRQDADPSFESCGNCRRRGGRRNCDFVLEAAAEQAEAAAAGRSVGDVATVNARPRRHIGAIARLEAQELPVSRSTGRRQGADMGVSVCYYVTMSLLFFS